MVAVESPCPDCSSTGKCQKCQGSGRAETGFFSKKVVNCSKCGALGKCHRCNGTGKIIRESNPGEEPIWNIMQAQAQEAQKKDHENRQRAEALKSRGLDPDAPEFEQLRLKHKVVMSPQRNGESKGAVWETMVRQAEAWQAMNNYLAELEEIARLRGL